MGFNQQLDVMMAILGTSVAFVGCILVIGISIKISFAIAACVLLLGLLFGRRVAEFVAQLF